MTDQSPWDTPPDPGHPAWTTTPQTGTPPYTPATRNWWQALLERITDSMAATPGACLVFADPAAIHERLDCEGQDLIRLANLGAINVRFNRYFLRILPGTMQLPEPSPATPHTPTAQASGGHGSCSAPHRPEGRSPLPYAHISGEI